MKSIFRTSFYLRSNYLNKDGKASIMMRIHLNGERMALGTTGVCLIPDLLHIVLTFKIQNGK